MARARTGKIDVEIIGTCATCKHWIRSTCHKWGVISFPETGPLEIDINGNGVNIETPAAFGCNQHEPKAEQA